MVPPLAALSAPSAAAVMGFRGRTLDMAKRNAGLYGFQGAHYPWETAPNDGTYT
jgi:trehalose/maltose hydrolase-like predicted phosphorylase